MQKSLACTFLIGLSLMTAACASAEPVGNTPVATGDGLKFRVETVASNLEVPRAFAWLPNGDMLFTERRGRVRIIEGGKLRQQPVYTVPDVEPTSESGLM